MKHRNSLLLGCAFLASVAHSTPTHAQVELTCRSRTFPKISPEVPLTEADCRNALQQFGLLQTFSSFFRQGGDPNMLTFSILSLPNDPRFSCFLTSAGVTVVGPVRAEGDRSCPSTTGGVGGSPHGYCPNQVEGDVPCEGQSPIVLDLSRSGFSFTSVKDGVDFDIDGDGVLERTAWTARGSDDAFLALDRNGNGTIDSGRELFGDVTVLRNGKTGAHGYIPLAELDHESNGGNGNGYVDHADRGFGALRLWTDRDHDGRSSSAELLPLSDRGIFAIALDADESDVVDEHGNRLAYVSPAYAWNQFRIERIRTTDIFFQFRELGR